MWKGQHCFPEGADRLEAVYIRVQHFAMENRSLLKCTSFPSFSIPLHLCVGVIRMISIQMDTLKHVLACAVVDTSGGQRLSFFYPSAYYFIVTGSHCESGASPLG